jgi:hypothetical protein
VRLVNNKEKIAKIGKSTGRSVHNGPFAVDLDRKFADVGRRPFR